MTIQEIIRPSFEQYQKFNNRYKKRQQEIEHLEERIQKLQEKLVDTKQRRTNAGQKVPNWTDAILRPIAEYLKNTYFPEYGTIEILGPFGLGNRVSICFIKDPFLERTDHDKFGQKENMLSITFKPGDLTKGELFYETGEVKNEYATQTLGDLNGFNYVVKPVETIEELANHLFKQTPHETKR